MSIGSSSMPPASPQHALEKPVASSVARTPAAGPAVLPQLLVPVRVLRRGAEQGYKAGAHRMGGNRGAEQHSRGVEHTCRAEVQSRGADLLQLEVRSNSISSSSSSTPGGCGGSGDG